MRILMIEDDADLAKGVGFNLKKAGYIIDYCYDGLDGYDLIKTQTYDMIILDRMLPGMDGLTILKHIRSLNIGIPVIMVTALSGLNDRIAGLNEGADDYLIKPFAVEELIARIQALSRRPRQIVLSQKIEWQDVSLDLSGLCLSGPKHSCSLSKTECALAELFLSHPGETLSRPMILSKVWGPQTEVEDGNLDNYIHFLRRRFNTIGSNLHIRTLRSIGYILEVKDVKEN